MRMLLFYLAITLNLISNLNVMVLSKPSLEIQIEDPEAEDFISLFKENKIDKKFMDLRSDDPDITYREEMIVTTLRVIIF